MLKKITKPVVIGLIALVLAAALIAGTAPAIIQRQAVKSFPLIDGEIKISGLDGEVDVFRDEYGIPHIYASTQHDLFFTQGYVHAQDRFWQMDFWRHQGAGRLSELLGKATLPEDQFLRTLGWERTARQEWELLDPESKAILLAYSEGVNAFLADHEGTDISLEYTFLPIINRGYTPAPWTPIHSLTWAKAMAWDLRANMDDEINRALLLSTLSEEQVDFLYPPYPGEHPIIVKDGQDREDSKVQERRISNSFDLNQLEMTRLLISIKSSIMELDGFSRNRPEGIGSNSWVVAGGRTTTGKPILANDPHLGVQMPSIWYQVGLHCLPGQESCQLDVTGFSFAGTPGVIIGHNRHIAWGLTNVGPDVMDLYIEKINPDNPNQYEYRGKWVDMEVISEEISIAGKEPVQLQVRITRHGPIISDVYGLENFHEEAGMDLPEQYQIALRWTALEPSCVFCAIWKINKARNWEEFQEAAREFAVPSQNLLYADVEGNIAYQMPGRIPVRTPNHTGVMPVPGWTGEYEWQGYIPFEELPSLLNPETGYIVTANNAVVDSSYPYTITHQWAYGFRAQRLVDLIESRDELIGIEEFMLMQGDSKDLLAEKLVPELLALIEDDDDYREAFELLSSWDYRLETESAAAALYMVFWDQLLEEVFSDQLPDFYDVGVDSCARQITIQLMEDPGSDWWDDRTTDEVETPPVIMKRALEGALQELRRVEGKELLNWSWGEIHGVSFEHQVMSSFPLVGGIFNRGPFPVAGGPGIVNANGWLAEEPYGVDWLPSMRMIVDLGDLSRSLAVHTTGQSGHAYHPHYIDMVELWLNMDNHAMLWNREEIEDRAEAHLHLLPGN